MKGAKPDAEAKMSNNPNSNNTVTIGMSNQSLRAHNKESNSPTTPKLDDILRKKAFMGTSNKNNY